MDKNNTALEPHHCFTGPSTFLLSLYVVLVFNPNGKKIIIVIIIILNIIPTVNIQGLRKLPSSRPGQIILTACWVKDKFTTINTFVSLKSSDSGPQGMTETKSPKKLASMYTRTKSLIRGLINISCTNSKEPRATSLYRTYPFFYIGYHFPLDFFADFKNNVSLSWHLGEMRNWCQSTDIQGSNVRCKRIPLLT